MKKILLTALLPSILFYGLSAQKHDYNWVLGYEYNATDPNFGTMLVDFNASPPLVYRKNMRMNFNTYSGVCSDSTGQLLFYTNGIRIFNKNNQLMEGGDTINPGQVWENTKHSGYVGAIAQTLPMPNSNNVYYLLHVGYENGGSVSFTYIKYIYYSIVDMNANNGFGKVLAKNQVLLEGDIVWPAFVKHGNGRDWWIMAMQRGDPKHLLFLLTPDGISGPMIQEIGPAFVPYEYSGKSLFSNNGNVFLRHDTQSGIRLYDFDRCTGQLSNLRILPYREPLHSWNAAFSPNDRFLYLSRPTWVWSIDMEAPDLSASFDTVAFWELNYYPTFPWTSQYFLNQLAPDGKIYWSSISGGSRSMNVLHRPDLPADAADCEEHALTLPCWNSQTITQFPNYRLGEWNNAPCDTLNGQKPGDGFTATEYEPERFRKDTAYTLLPPIPGAACPGCSARDIEILNNPMELSRALIELEATGKLPADWPVQHMGNEALFIKPRSDKE